MPVYVFDASIVGNNVGACREMGLSDHSFKRMALCEKVSIELAEKRAFPGRFRWSLMHDKEYLEVQGQIVSLAGRTKRGFGYESKPETPRLNNHQT